MFAISFEVDVANFSANRRLLGWMQLWCLWGFVLFWVPSKIIHKPHIGKHYVLDLGGPTGLLERPLYFAWKWLKSMRVSCHDLTTSPYREGFGDFEQINHLQVKFNFQRAAILSVYNSSFSVTWVHKSSTW